jgi:hypothetical protein
VPYSIGNVTIGTGPVPVQHDVLPLGTPTDSDITPKTFNLSQNFPNPFNPTTTIKYKVPEAVHVQLVVYNVDGRRLRVLVNEFTPPGDYQNSWDGRNDKGDIASSGVYFYRMKAGAFDQTKKLVFMK